MPLPSVTFAQTASNIGLPAKLVHTKDIRPEMVAETGSETPLMTMVKTKGKRPDWNERTTIVAGNNGDHSLIKLRELPSS